MAVVRESLKRGSGDPTVYTLPEKRKTMQAQPTVGILSPGDMGHAIGAVLRQHGLRVLTSLQGRSTRTVVLAALYRLVGQTELGTETPEERQRGQALEEVTGILAAALSQEVHQAE